MKAKKLLASALCLAMVLALLPTIALASPSDPLDLLGTCITDETLIGTVDGETLEVRHYVAVYEADPIETVVSGTPTNNNKINIYIPETATEKSPIIFIVNNSGWQSNAFPTNTISDGFSYDSSDPNTSNPDRIGVALSEGYVIISYGARSRGQVDEDGSYEGHSPATMTDTKAAIRYLRYNYELGNLTAGNPNRIVVTGTSGGGGLSTVIAASGNSPDYYESLYEVGAAGIDYIDGEYVSTISDAVFATIAYCPIADLPMADQAYEWTYNATRAAQGADSAVNGSLQPLENNTVMQASAELAADFVGYINGFGLKDENGVLLTAEYTDPETGELAGVSGGTFRDAMQRLLEKGVNKAIYEVSEGSASADSVTGLDTYSAWLEINGGTPSSAAPDVTDIATISDLEAYLNHVATNKALKTAPAFSNKGTINAAGQNEDNLFGASTDYEYSPYEFWAWDNHDTASGVTKVGADNTGLTWDEYLETDEGETLALQMKMTSPIPYLNGADNIPYLVTSGADSSDDCDPAAYWYVRHGMADRDTSFAVGTLLNYSLLANDAVNEVNFNFAWQKAHSGDYDVAEAYAWLKEVVYVADTFDAVAEAIPTGNVTESFDVPVADENGNTITYTSSKENVAKFENGQIVITRPSASTTVTLTVTILSDITANDGVNYSSVEETRTYTFTVSGIGGGSGGGTTATKAVTVASAANGTVKANNTSPKSGDTVTVSATPNNGYKLDTLTITDAKGNQLTYTDNGDGTYSFTYGGSPVTIKASFVPLSGGTAQTVPYIDIIDSAWYKEYVLFVYENGLMEGTTAATFEPDTVTTRAMVMTVLYRMDGEPAATGTNRFTDLPQDWYKDAVQWAVDNEITYGTTQATFAQDAPVTREQLATFLYRFAGCKGYETEADANLSGYSDLSKVNVYALDAMAWANANGIITGETSTTLNPAGESSRAVLATMLTRFSQTVVDTGTEETAET